MDPERIDQAAEQVFAVGPAVARAHNHSELQVDVHAVEWLDCE